MSIPRSRSCGPVERAAASAAVGSSQRSRKTVSTSCTAGPLMAAWTSCQGGVSPYSSAIVEGLRVAAVVGVVAAGVAQVDAADVRDVAGRVVAVPDDHQLLVVRAARCAPACRAAPRRRAAAAAGRAGGSRSAVKPSALRVRAPDQPAYVDAALVGPAEHLDDLAARLAGEPLVGVALPVGEEDQVAGAGGLEPLVELGEVRRPVDQRADQVALRPGLLAGVPGRRAGCAGCRARAWSAASRWGRGSPARVTLPQNAVRRTRRSERETDARTRLDRAPARRAEQALLAGDQRRRRATVTTAARTLIASIGDALDQHEGLQRLGLQQPQRHRGLAEAERRPTSR